MQVRAAISARVTSWRETLETRQPSSAGRHQGYASPRAVIVATHPDDIALPTKAALKAAV